MDTSQRDRDLFYISRIPSLTLYTPQEIVNTVIELFDGCLATRTNSSLLKVWSRTTGECLTTYTHNTDLRALLELNPHQVAFGDFKGYVHIWERDANLVSSTFKGCHSKGSFHSVWCLLRLDHNILASGSSDTTIKLWNITTGDCIMTMEGAHRDFVKDLAMMPPHLELGDFMSSSKDGIVKIWKRTFNPLFNEEMPNYVSTSSFRVQRGAMMARILQSGSIMVSQILDDPVICTSNSNGEWTMETISIGSNRATFVEAKRGILVFGNTQGECLVWRESDRRFVSSVKYLAGTVHHMFLLRDGSLFVSFKNESMILKTTNKFVALQNNILSPD